MTDDFDRLIKDAAPGYNAPPSVDPERVWAGIQTGRQQRACVAEHQQPASRRIVRAAAVIVAIVVPVIGVAQVLSYLKRDRTPPSVPHGVTSDQPLAVMLPGVVPRAVSPLDTGEQGPAAHDLGAVVATSSITFKGDVSVVALAGGRVLAADARPSVFIRLLDSTFTHVTVVVDSTSGESAVLPPGRAVPHRGDSALVPDNRQQPAVLVIVTPDGRIDRTMALPRCGRCAAITRGHGAIQSSATLGLIFRFFNRVDPGFNLGQPTVLVDTWRASVPTPLLRMSWESRELDTLAWFGANNVWVVDRADGSNIDRMQSFFPFVDEAVATTDGAVALFRAREYRIEWILPDGTKGPPSAPLPYPWRRITDDMRARIVDSINTERMRVYDSVAAKRAADSARTGQAPTQTRTVDADAVMAGSTAGGGGGRGASAGGIPSIPKPTVTIEVPLPLRRPIMVIGGAVPDFFPPTAANLGSSWGGGNGSVLADADNNVWIRGLALRAADGAWVWDVVNRERGLIERVRIPEDREIVGFGPGGIVYLLARDAGVGRLEKVRVRK